MESKIKAQVQAQQDIENLLAMKPGDENYQDYFKDFDRGDQDAQI